MKKFVKGVSGALGLAGIFYLGIPRQADAQSVDFAGFVKGAYAQNAKVRLMNANGDSAIATANFYVPKLDAYYWSKSTNIVTVNDTCWIRFTDAANSGKKQDIWTIVGGTNGIITANLDKNLWNYSIDVMNVTDGLDTLIRADLRLKRQGRFSDVICDTFNTASDYDDISLNAAKSESVQVWTNNGNNPNNILGDSIFITVRSIINPNKVGSSRGIVRRFWYNIPYSTGGGWGDHLPDIVLQVGVIEENKLENLVQENKLIASPNPTKGNIILNQEGDYYLYNVLGQEVLKGNYQKGKKIDLDGLSLPNGAYLLFLKPENNELLKPEKVIYLK